MIGIEDFPKRAVDVPRKIRHAARADFAQKNLRDVRPRRLREHFLHWQIGIRRDQRERRRSHFSLRRHVHAPHAVDDPRRVLETAEERMAGRLRVLEAEVGVVHRAFGAAREARAEQLREAEVLSLHAPLVVQRSFRGGDDAAAARDELAQLNALRVGEGRDVWQDERFEIREVLRVEQPVVHHLERDARLDERVIPAIARILERIAHAAFTRDEPRRLLRIDDRHARERALVAQVAFRAGAPAVEFLDRFQPARIVDAAGEFREPRAQAVRDAVERPEAKLRGALHRIFPAVGLLQPDAENAHDRLAAHRRAKFLSLLPVAPRHGDAAARLMVGHQRRREFADALHVERTRRAAPAVGDHARVGIDRAHRAVPLPPEREEPLLPPQNVGAPRRVLRIGGARQFVAAGLAKIFPAALAVTLARAIPAVDKNPVHTVARRDLALHLGHEIEIVGPEPAGDPHLGRRPVATALAVGVDVNPLGMRGLGVVVGRVRIGARDHDHAEFAAARDEFAEHIAVAEPRAAMVKRNRRRVIRHATAAAQAHRVGFRARKIIEPERQVELARIVLDERELRPAHRLVDPRRRGRNRGRRCGGAGDRTFRGARRVQGEFAECDGRAGDGGGFEKIATRGFGHGAEGLRLFLLSGKKAQRWSCVRLSCPNSPAFSGQRHDATRQSPA